MVQHAWVRYGTLRVIYFSRLSTLALSKWVWLCTGVRAGAKAGRMEGTCGGPAHGMEGTCGGLCVT